jgi:thiol:disulfide interchange protein DsbC
MKKISKILLTGIIIGVTSLSLYATNNSNNIKENIDKQYTLNNIQAQNVLKNTFLWNNIQKDIKDKKISLFGKDLGDLYGIRITDKRLGKSGVVYITKDKKYVILGKVVNNKTKTIVNIRKPVDIKKVEKAITFTAGEGSKNLYIITDPECPYCRMLQEKKGKDLFNNYKLHIILFPLSFHKYAKGMSYYILAGKTNKERFNRFKDTLSGGNKWKNFDNKVMTAKEQKEFDKQLNYNLKIGEELGVRGTPTIYDSKFKEVRF